MAPVESLLEAVLGQLQFSGFLNVLSMQVVTQSPLTSQGSVNLFHTFLKHFRDWVSARSVWVHMMMAEDATVSHFQP